MHFTLCKYHYSEVCDQYVLVFSPLDQIFLTLYLQGTDSIIRIFSDWKILYCTIAVGSFSDQDEA